MEERQFDYNVIFDNIGNSMEITTATGSTHFGELVDVVNDVLLLLDTNNTKVAKGFAQSWEIPLEDIKAVFVVHGGFDVYKQLLATRLGHTTAKPGEGKVKAPKLEPKLNEYPRPGK